MRALALAGLALLSAAGCASPPHWVRRTPVLNWIWRPYAQPYLENPKFSFEIKRDWKGPEPVDGGVRFRAPHSTGRIAVSYHLEGSEGWKEPKVYRKWLHEQGSTEDSRVVDEVEISSRPAAHAVFTSHEYDPEYLLGVKEDVRMTEMMVLYDEQGLFVMRLDASRADFPSARRVFARFLDSLSLAIVEKPPED